MAYDSHYDKQQRRDAERKQQRSRRKSPVGRYLALSLVAVVGLLVAGVLIFRSLSQSPTEPQISTSVPPVSTTPAPTQPTQPLKPTDQIQLVFGGDLVVNDLVVGSGENDGRYDYTALFMDIAPILSSAHAAGINFEGTTAGKPYGTASASAPPELLNALANAGVDLVQLSNSCTVSNGILGLRATLQDVEKAGMMGVGAYADKEKAQREQGFTLCQIGGLRVAFVGFTKGFDGLSLPQNSQWCVNLLYSDYATTYQKVAQDAILETLKNVEAQKPDLTVALLHWGSTYNDIISASQKKIEQLMLENGVDAIIGTHSHLVQQVKFDEEAGTVVAYSLGDFFGGGEKNGSHYSILLQLKVTRDNYTGETAITGCDYVPIYTLSPERDGEPMQVVRIETAIEQYENSHIHRVNATAYENMKAALKQILRRVGF
jgi:poly-gamma-glutamate synthesis protein (capsule biosynthesis protein)